MKFKRTLLLTTLSAFLLLSLAACGEKKSGYDPRHPASIVIWHYYNGKQKDAFDALVSQFNNSCGAEKGIIITAESRGNVDDLAKAVTDSANNKAGSEPLPDMFASYADSAYLLYEQGLLANIKPYLSEQEIAQYLPDFWEEGELSPGEYYVFPMAKSTELLYLDETNWEPFAAETGALLSDLSTWEGLSKTAELYYGWSGGKAFFGRDAFANYLIVGTKQLGKEIFSSENGKTIIQLDKEVMRRLWDCYAVPYLKGYYNTFGRFRSDDMKTGDLLAYVGSTASSSYFPTQITLQDGSTHPIKGRVLPLPTFEGVEAFSIQQGAGMSISKSDTATETACVEFLKWLTDTPQNTAFCIQAGYIPVKITSNSEANLTAAMDQAGIEKGSLIYENELMSADAVNHVTLYTNKPFANAIDARNTLTEFMTSRLDQQRESLAGLTKAEIDAQIDSLFESWFTELENALNF